MLFDQEQLNISQLYAVMYYKPVKLSHKYLRKPPFYELTYYAKGDSTINFNGKTLHVSTGDIVFIPKYIGDENYTVEANSRFSLYNIYFDTDVELPNEAIVISAKNENIKHLFDKIHNIWVGHQPGYYLKCMQLAYEIFSAVRNMQTNYEPKEKLLQLSASEDYMANHYCDTDFDYETLISLSGLSYSYFKKLFISKYGVPPVKHITRLRINRACELLQSDKFTISEIARACGFENIYYFSNVFKKLMGVSPKKYGSYIDNDAN